jgi:hypothetical protein
VVNAIAHNHIETPWLTKERFVAGGAAAIAVAGRFLLGIRLRFHNHPPQQLAIGLAFHQQAADEVGGDLLGGAGEEGLGEGWEGVDGFGGGFVRKGLRGADRTAVAGL